MISRSHTGVISILDAHKPELLCELSRGDIDMNFRDEFSAVTDHIVSVCDYKELLLWKYKEI